MSMKLTTTTSTKTTEKTIVLSPSRKAFKLHEFTVSENRIKQAISINSLQHFCVDGIISVKKIFLESV